MDFSTIEITSKQVRENNLDFLTIEITSKKVRGIDVDISTIEITSKKVRGIDVDISTIEITSKKHMESTWKIVEIWSSTYRRNTYIESTSIRQGVPVGHALHAFMSHWPYSLRTLVSHMFRAIRVSYPSCLCASFVLFLALANASCALSSMSFITRALLLYGLACLTCTLWLVPCMIQVKISTFVDLCFHVSCCFKFKFISYLWAFLGNLLWLTWT